MLEENPNLNIGSFKNLFRLRNLKNRSGIERVDIGVFVFGDRNMSKWKKYEFWPFEDWFSIPESPGCYAIYCDGVLVYIGQSKNVFRRLESHNINYGYSNTIFTPWGHCTSVFVKVRMPRRLGEALMIEHRLLTRLKPKFNCVGGQRKRKLPVGRASKIPSYNP